MDEMYMTYGVVCSKVETLLEEIKIELCTNAANALRDNEQIKTNLKNAWSGADCDVFITNFDKAVETTCQALTNYETQIRATLNSIPQQWSEFQSKNVISN